MRCKSKVKINHQRIKQLSESSILALEQTAEALHTEEVQAAIIPRDSGTLEGEAFFVDKSQSSGGKVSLVNTTPYARRLYYHPEYHFHQQPWEETIYKQDETERTVKHDGNSNAKGKWHEDWLAGGSKADFVPKTFKKLYQRLAGL